MLEIDIKLLPFQGVTNERALTQGVASLALGYVHHWAFSPPLLNTKLQLLYFSTFPFALFYSLSHAQKIQIPKIFNPKFPRFSIHAISETHSLQ